jgi:hypothetical protein
MNRLIENIYRDKHADTNTQARLQATAEFAADGSAHV